MKARRSPSCCRAIRAVLARHRRPRYNLLFTVSPFDGGAVPPWCGPLAQLAEQQTLNLRVVGSIPTRLTRILSKFNDFSRDRRTGRLPNCLSAKASPRRAAMLTTIVRATSASSLPAENRVHLRGRLDLQRLQDVACRCSCVRLICECPSVSMIVRGSTPIASNSVAAVCRRS